MRWKGHFEGDPEVYRTKEEIEEGKKQDPIARFEKRLLDLGALTPEKIDAIKKEVDDETADALEFARKSDFPPIEELYTDMDYDTCKPGE